MRKRLEENVSAVPESSCSWRANSSRRYLATEKPNHRPRDRAQVIRQSTDISEARGELRLSGVFDREPGIAELCVEPIERDIGKLGTGAEALDEIREVATVDLLCQEGALWPQHTGDLGGVERGVAIEYQVERPIWEWQVGPASDADNLDTRGARRRRASLTFGGWPSVATTRTGNASAIAASRSPPPVPRSRASPLRRSTERARSSYDQGGCSSCQRPGRYEKSQPLKGSRTCRSQSASRPAALSCGPIRPLPYRPKRTRTRAPWSLTRTS